jgi:hypothetical protein
MQAREKLRQEVYRAFERTGAATYQSGSWDIMVSTNETWLNFGLLGQRRVLVVIDYRDRCRIQVSRLFDAPDGKTAHAMHADGEGDTVIAVIPASTPNLGEDVVRIVREVLSGIEPRESAAGWKPLVIQKAGI